MYKRGRKKYMKLSKLVIIGIAIVVIILTLIFLLNKGSIDRNPVVEMNDSRQSEVTVIKIQPTVPKAPTPTFAPVGTVVKSINADKIIIENQKIKGSTFTLSKSQTGVKYFIRKGGNLVSASLEDVKVGQKVTLNIIKPGVEAQFIIEL
jgi:hypothetical protein